MAISNVIIDGVPAGGEDDFVVLDTVGEPRGDRQPEGPPRARRVARADRHGARREGVRCRGSTSSPVRARCCSSGCCSWPCAWPPRTGSPSSSRRCWCARRSWRAPVSSARTPRRSTASRPTTSISSARRRCRWPATTPTRSSTCPTVRCATRAGRRASAGRRAATARTPAASSACTSSTRSRASSTASRRRPRPNTSGCSAGSARCWRRSRCRTA